MYTYKLKIVLDIFCAFTCLQTLSVLNPLQQTESNIMDDTDLAGPLVFCLAFGGFLLLVSK
jgi:hypothetical protein